MNIFGKIKYQPLNQNDLEADNHHIIEDEAVEREKINFIDYLNVSRFLNINKKYI